MTTSPSSALWGYSGAYNQIVLDFESSLTANRLQDEGSCPLGFIAPFTLLAKKLLQDLCRNEHLGWDDDIPENYRGKWQRWCAELPMLEQWHVDRSYKPPDFGTVVSRQLHLFSDASTMGYGCVAYLRLQDDSNRIHCSFLMGKSRLTSTNVVTVPRLELTAATVSVRVGQMLYEELELKPEAITYHTDSKTVLRYIGNEQKRFQIFVANRVQSDQGLH